jgi:hypothetical protein
LYWLAVVVANVSICEETDPLDTLSYTAAGKQAKQESHYRAGKPSVRQTQHQYDKEGYEYSSPDFEKPSSGSLIGNLIWYGMIAWLGYSLYISFCRGTGGVNRPPVNRGGGYPGGGGGGGGYPGGGGGGYPGTRGGDAPPPYSPDPSAPPANDSKPSQSRTSESSRTESSGPGFFTGAAAGAAMGYMMGNRSANNRNINAERDRMAYERERLGGGMFGGRSSPRTSSAPSTSSGTGGVQTTTGFGSTRRR